MLQKLLKCYKVLLKSIKQEEHIFLIGNLSSMRCGLRRRCRKLRTFIKKRNKWKCWVKVLAFKNWNIITCHVPHVFGFHLWKLEESSKTIQKCDTLLPISRLVLGHFPLCKFLAKNKMAVILYTPYSLDLSTSDFFLFPKLKKALEV